MINSGESAKEKATHHESSSSSYGQISYSDEENPAKKKSDTDSSLERSFEVIGSNEGHQSIDEESHIEGNQSYDYVSSSSNKQSEPQSLGTSLQQRLRSSGSFLVKSLQSSKDENREAPRKSSIPSGFASALSSISSLTSGFSQSADNHNQNQKILSSSNSGASLSIETASNITKFSHVSETKEDIFIKKAATERKNLINLTKLIVKDLISSYLSTARTADDCDTIHLRNYFVLIERVMKHGLKDNVFSGRSSNLWTTLESLPKYMNESTLIAESIRSLANTRTADGKVRAWMRLAMMQKKLPEYFNELLANKDVLLKNSYHDYAFMLNDEAHIFAGLLIGVNVIDCNFFVKESNFDLMDDVIDLSPYLRHVNSFDSDDHRPDGLGVGRTTETNLSNKEDELKSILDQKNYLEEWNKRLEGTNSDLQRKIKSLEESNSKLEMEAKLTEARLSKLKLHSFDAQHHESAGVTSSIAGAIKSMIINNSSDQQETSNIQTSEQKSSSSKQGDEAKSDQDIGEDHDEQMNLQVDNINQPVQKESNCNDDFLASQPSKSIEKTSLKSEISSTDHDNERKFALKEKQYQIKINELEKGLARLRERTSILETSYRSSLEKLKVLEADLDIQTSMNADKESTIRIYEKDIRDKQAQVDNLRNSLNDAKTLNSSLNERFNDAGVKLKERIKMVTSLQTSLDKWKLENKTIATRLQEKSVQLKTALSDLEKATKTIDELKQYNIRVTDELKHERESGQCSTFTLETRQKKIDDLTEQIKELEKELKSISPFQAEAQELRQKCKDYEQSLEEIGNRFRESRLEIDTLRENSALFTECQWIDDKQVKECYLCRQVFSVTRRKHHCRLCGNVFCQTCSDNKMELASSSKPMRVCDTCHSFLLAKFVKSASSHS